MKTIKNVGELRNAIADLSDELLLEGSLQIHTGPPSPPIVCDPHRDKTLGEMIVEATGEPLIKLSEGLMHQMIGEILEPEERFLLIREENLTEHGADRLYVRTYDPDHQGDRGLAFSRANLEAQVREGYRVFIALSEL